MWENALTCSKIHVKEVNTVLEIDINGSFKLKGSFKIRFYAHLEHSLTENCFA